MNHETIGLPSILVGVSLICLFATLTTGLVGHSRRTRILQLGLFAVAVIALSTFAILVKG